MNFIRPLPDGSIETELRGRQILSAPLINKGVAFTQDERESLGLIGLLPTSILTLGEQSDRAYEQYHSQPSDLAKNVFLTALHDRNEVLFYRLLMDHLEEMLPIVYSPTVGEAIQRYSHEYRTPRGVYLSIDHPEHIEKSFTDLGVGPEDIDLIVATDAEAILGIGDWGVGGINISVGKLIVYTAAAGIDPGRVIPVMLDVGSDRDSLLNDEVYIGNRHPRVRGEKYFEFIDLYVQTVQRLFPHALLHWEDFSADNAREILNRYRDQFATFNDDMQGTGAIALATALSGCKLSDCVLEDQKIVIFGSGTAGIGIADQLRDAMVRHGLSKDEATRHFWCVDRDGLLTDNMGDSLHEFQRPYARPISEVSGWDRVRAGIVDLAELIKQVRPTMLIGTSAVPGAFGEALVKEMAAHVERPIILPLSNPTSRVEATPKDLITWTDGRAIVATGSPFDAVAYDGTLYEIGQANNALLYPGLGLGTIVCRASKITDTMFYEAALAVANMTDLNRKGAPVLPPMRDVRSVSANVAIATIRAAIRDGVAQRVPSDIELDVASSMWWPIYRTIRAI